MLTMGTKCAFACTQKKKSTINNSQKSQAQENVLGGGTRARRSEQSRKNLKDILKQAIQPTAHVETPHHQ
jgi:hypothetical protein